MVHDLALRIATSAGRHPELIRRLVRLGLLEVTRDARGDLWFDPSQVAAMGRIQRLRSGLGLNYAAYESEIYRSAMEAVSRGQLDAARTLGFTNFQTFRLIRAPQAFRLALAPMTNDFVALLNLHDADARYLARLRIAAEQADRVAAVPA